MFYRILFFVLTTFSINLFSYQLDLSKGWSLLGAIENLQTSEIKSKENCIDFIWGYRDGNWKLHITNGKTYSYTGDKLIQIQKGEGFWIKTSKDCNITISKSTRAVRVDDKYYKYMWNLNPLSIYNKDGRVVKNADINITKAWEKTYGEGITVAVIDDCFDANHPDLYDNIKNTYNINSDKKDVSGENCHGTEVAGIIGAIKNNKGILGVAPKVKLVLISINLEKSTDSQFVKAFEYAKNQGAKVISCSWGSYNISQILHDELKSIHDNNIKIVFASGNDNINLDEEGHNDESEDKYVIGVGATDENNDVAYYSNYGSNIDILAPGGSDIGILTTKGTGGYNYVLGTSFAAPTVAGAIALKLSLNPNLTFEQIRDNLIDSADKVGIENGANYINGFDRYRAYGKINTGNFIND